MIYFSVKEAYDAIKSSAKDSSAEPVPYYPNVTSEDVERGYMIRYFVRQANHVAGEITEVEDRNADVLKRNPLYRVIELRWRVKGALEDQISNGVRVYTGVITSNRLSLEDAEKELPGMQYQIRNLKNFWVGQ